MKIFGRKPTISAWIGMVIVAVFIFMAVFAPWIGLPPEKWSSLK